MAGWQKGKGWGWFWGKDDEIGALNAITAGFCWGAVFGHADQRSFRQGSGSHQHFVS